MPMLAYTGKEWSTMSREPPRIGAIIPPLEKEARRVRGLSSGECPVADTYIRERADAMPHAVPRTVWGNVRATRRGLETRGVPFVPKISGVHPYSTAHMAC